jgi:hypothetical protein
MLLCKPRCQFGYAINRVSSISQLTQLKYNELRNNRINPCDINKINQIAKLNAGYRKGCIPRLPSHKQSDILPRHSLPSTATIQAFFRHKLFIKIFLYKAIGVPTY